MTAAAATLAVLIVLYAVVASRLARWSVSMPMVFVSVGFLLGPGGTGVLSLSPSAEVVQLLTEITLALVLFTDASTLHVREIQHDVALPLRLLTIGMLLTMGLGGVAAFVAFPQTGWVLAGLFGAILAPTDAALGLPMFTNPRVPVRIRRTLNVESGLNDGIATPFVTLWISLATATEGLSNSNWLGSALLAMALAVLVGTSVGVSGGVLLKLAMRCGWTARGSVQIAILGLGLVAYLGALTVHGNGFVAAFVAGVAFGAATRGQFAETTEFTETLSTVLAILVWVVFGAVFVTEAAHHTTDWRPIVFATASVTLVRMVPVALAMARTGLRRETVLLMGWFGPRGLASVVFALLALVQLEAVGGPVDTLMLVATWTILLSVFAHGLTAQPLSVWYAGRLRNASPVAPELASMPELRKRHSALQAHADPDGLSAHR